MRFAWKGFLNCGQKLIGTLFDLFIEPMNIYRNKLLCRRSFLEKLFLYDKCKQVEWTYNYNNHWPVLVASLALEYTYVLNKAFIGNRERNFSHVQLNFVFIYIAWKIQSTDCSIANSKLQSILCVSLSQFALKFFSFVITYYLDRFLGITGFWTTPPKNVRNFWTLILHFSSYLRAVDGSL